MDQDSDNDWFNDSELKNLYQKALKSIPNKEKPGSEISPIISTLSSQKNEFYSSPHGSPHHKGFGIKSLAGGSTSNLVVLIGPGSPRPTNSFSRQVPDATNAPHVSNKRDAIVSLTKKTDPRLHRHYSPASSESDFDDPPVPSSLVPLQHINIQSSLHNKPVSSMKTGTSSESYNKSLPLQTTKFQSVQPMIKPNTVIEDDNISLSDVSVVDINLGEDDFVEEQNENASTEAEDVKSNVSDVGESVSENEDNNADVVDLFDPDLDDDFDLGNESISSKRRHSVAKAKDTAHFLDSHSLKTNSTTVSIKARLGVRVADQSVDCHLKDSNGKRKSKGVEETNGIPVLHKKSKTDSYSKSRSSSKSVNDDAQVTVRNHQSRSKSKKKSHKKEKKSKKSKEMKKKKKSSERKSGEKSRLKSSHKHLTRTPSDISNHSSSSPSPVEPHIVSVVSPLKRPPSRSQSPVWVERECSRQPRLDIPRHNVSKYTAHSSVQPERSSIHDRLGDRKKKFAAPIVESSSSQRDYRNGPALSEASKKDLRKLIDKRRFGNLSDREETLYKRAIEDMWKCRYSSLRS